MSVKSDGKPLTRKLSEQGKVNHLVGEHEKRLDGLDKRVDKIPFTQAAMDKMLKQFIIPGVVDRVAQEMTEPMARIRELEKLVGEQEAFQSEIINITLKSQRKRIDKIFEMHNDLEGKIDGVSGKVSAGLETAYDARGKLRSDLKKLTIQADLLETLGWMRGNKPEEDKGVTPRLSEAEIERRLGKIEKALFFPIRKKHASVGCTSTLPAESKRATQKTVLSAIDRARSHGGAERGPLQAEVHNAALDLVKREINALGWWANDWGKCEIGSSSPGIQLMVEYLIAQRYPIGDFQPRYEIEGFLRFMEKQGYEIRRKGEK